MKWLLPLLDGLIHMVREMPPRSEPAIRREHRLEEFRRSIMRLRTVEDGLTEILSFTSELFQSSHVGILIWNEDQGQFMNRCTVPNIRTSWNVYDPFIVKVADYDQAIALSEIESAVKASDRRIFLEFARDTGAKYILPLILNETVLAVLFIGPCIPPEPTLIQDFRTYAVLALSNSVIYTRVESLLVSLEDKVRERTQQLEDAANQMIQSEKMATLGVMVAGVAHELNTPSGVILNASENLFGTLDSFLDRMAIHEWLPETPQIERFIEIIRFFNYHMLTGSQGFPSSVFQLRRHLRQSLKELGIPGGEDLASFFIDHGFILDEAGAGSIVIRERMRGDNLFAMILSLHGELDDTACKRFLAYLRDIASIYRNVKNITTSAASIARLVKALRIYSRSGVGNFVKASIEESLDTTLEIMGSIWKNQVRLNRQYSHIPPVECDPDRLNQVWSNLLVNAYHAVRGRKDPVITLQTDIDDDRVCIRIRDNGPGIPKDVREKIWDPFFTTKDQGEGTGLGLAIVRKIVEEHLGSIHFETGESGTEFTIRIPVERANRSAGKASNPGPGRYDWR